MKIKKFIVVTLLYITILFSTYYLHITFFNVDVVFYDAVIDVVVAALILIIFIFKLKYFELFTFFEKAQASIIMLLLGYALAITVPTVIDRSLSFYILEKIEQQGGGIKYSSINDIFTEDYLVEHRLMDIRITEQIESGTIKFIDSCIVLTDRGRYLSSFSRFFRKNFLPKKRLIQGKYTDDLVDPFSNGSNLKKYSCQKEYNLE
jgi:hypothetical protein